MILHHQTEVFQTIIPLTNRVAAEQFRRYQAQGNKAKQVYLNTLAVSAVNYYLNFIGWSTDLETSDSWNPVLQTMLDVADLQIPGYGKVECRCVLEGEDFVIIPPEVWSERIAYVIVQLSKSLERGTLLGFVGQVTQQQLPLTQLASLAEFPTYLSQQRHTTPIPPAKISQWFSDRLDRGWQHLEELFAPQIALNFRSPQQLANQTPEKLSSQISRVKLISLGVNPQVDIALVLQIQSQCDQEYNISLIVFDSQLQNYLPEGLEVIIYDLAHRPVMIAQANETETIEFCFSGRLEERFDIEFALDEQIRVESFII